VPDPETSKLLALARRTPSNLRYFFERLDDPGWIDVLEREGFFASPAAVERTEDDEGTWLRFPDWPASRYLARVASAAPERVAQLLLALPDTHNVRVHEDIIEAAQQMPTEWADRLAEREMAWFTTSTGPLLNYAFRFVDLGISLLESEREERALAIFDAVLTLYPAENPSSSRQRPGTRLSKWEYREAAEKIWPPLLEHEGPDGLRFIAGKLQRAVELSMRENGHDLSYLWRKAIEDHKQNLGDSVFDALVNATRDMALAAATDDPERVLQVLGEFEAPIFARLRLHVLRVVGDRLPRATAETLLNRENLEDPDLWHEYAELLRARFSQLGIEQEARLLRMIHEGTADEAADETEQGEALRAYRRYTRLAVIADHLDGEMRADYEALVVRYGPPDHPEFLAHTSSWTGPTSPLSGEEIRLRTPAELVEFLNDWEPEQTPGSHSSPEGLGRLLTEVVAGAPEPYASEALRFIGRDPTYVRALLGGLEQAAKAGSRFDWQRPLELAKWVTEQPESEWPDHLNMERDTSWRWARKEIARLLGRGLEAGAASFAAENREVVWSLLSRLAEDPEPAPSMEPDENGMDPATRSLNVTRGEAMHSVVRFAMWVERLEGDAFQGLASVPKAQACLERHLDPDRDSSPAVRAVYGMWLAQLVRIDEHWVADHTRDILPTAIDEARLFAAAWNAYVVFTRPWLGVLPLIEHAYVLAVERLPEEPPERGLTDRPDEKLAEHLVWYAVMSAIPFEEPGLWRDYWERASPHLREHTVEHLGRMFKDATDVPEEVRERAHQLWTWISAHVEEKQRPQTLAAFGWLLSAKALDDEWLLTQALELLEEGIHLEADFIVWEALTRTVETYPAASAGVLRMMIQTDPNRWSVSGSEETVRQILEKAIASGDPEARRRAKDAINVLGARGMHGFRDIAERFLE
jgi:tetratricopeptide (TPR) repeat protein